MAQQFLSTLDANNVGRIINLPAPASANEPARLADLNSAVEGLSWKDGCRVATQANLNVAAPGATIDGVTMATSDRVLVRAQTAGAENGIYLWNGAATPMTRALDANTSDELEQAVVTIEEGTSAGATFRQSTVNFTLGTGTVTWVTFGTSAPPASETTAGIVELATQAETDSGTDTTRVVTPATLATWSGRLRKVAQTIGDASATQFTITHNWNTRDVAVHVYRTSGAFDEVLVDREVTTLNSVTIRFNTAPSAGAFRAVVIG
jgi:hypothetical protein